MAYLHEQALRKAMARLRILGGPDRRGPTAEENIGSALMGIAGAFSGPGSTITRGPTNHGQHGPLQLATGNVGGAATQEVVNQWSDPQDRLKDWGAETAAQINAQEEATPLRLGGQFGPTGLKDIVMNSQANANDRMKAKALIGQGMQYGINGTPY